MGVKIRGIEQAKRNLDRIIGDVQGRKVVSAIKAALIIIAPEAARMTPVAKSSFLINSQFQEVMVNGTRITGRVGYAANYAVYVHEAKGTLKGKPRPASQGGGNYWDPAGEPQFLKKAGDETRSAVDAAIKKELSL
ncbi:TPA: HK97 gp10 family phage protein [Klebsiella oxytoca]|uniref:HK97 gp10 family phage protein n=1 Tax=Klebsiella TaxID=570 RepID=UPI001B954BDC|nr:MULTISPECIES: HK97 gp10 family phage protein [Klebsiella]MCW9662134.1 HK97 gp10 family phage protein [Klebsiella oxytoca]MDS7886317.1 HK97 gp10 family phage protein [Klebsiella michiganensis]HBC7877561.1 HK97 gp10 family phage protein [Klebsiella oxytoca]HCL7585001.1 HK97 gp10 family phage protein [Klebsiella oxytoca]HCQ8454659.1 HK97 gp10 family phage protein [Klebsiella oxytoca]